MADTGRSIFANGNIKPWTAIMLDTSVDNKAIQATANAQCLGIAQKGTRNAPWTPLDDGFCAIAGEMFEYYADGEENVPALLGGTVTTERRLKSDANGALIAITTDGDFQIAIARATGVAGDVIRVDVVRSQVAL